MRDRSSPLAPLVCAALALAGCGGGGGHGTTTSGVTAASVEEGAPAGWVVGQVALGTGGAEVFLVDPDAGGTSVYALQRSILTSDATDDAGRFRLPLDAPAQPGYEVLVSAPGRALTRAPLAAVARIETAPEAIVRCVVRDEEGAPVVEALAFPLDARGIPLPVPALDLVSREDGALSATRLPAGLVELLVVSPDGARFAAIQAEARAGETTEVTVTLRADAALEHRFYRTLGGPDEGPHRLLEEVGQ